MAISRRCFLQQALAAGVVAGARKAFSDPLGIPIGFQGYDARFLLIKDWDFGWQTAERGWHVERGVSGRKRRYLFGRPRAGLRTASCYLSGSSSGLSRTAGRVRAELWVWV